MIKIEDEHTIDETLLTKNGWVLDLGCANFRFGAKIKEYCNNVICVDANPSIKIENNNIIFKNLAIINDNNTDKETKYFIYNDKNGNSLLNPNNDWCVLIEHKIVPTTTIKNLMIEFNIKQFDLIKMDIEGSEYKLLEDIDWTISKQYSIEFHDFRNMNPYSPDNDKYYENLFKRTLLYCDIIKHEKTNHPGFPNGKGLNYWDSLFILKKEYHI